MAVISLLRNYYYLIGVIVIHGWPEHVTKPQIVTQNHDGNLYKTQKY